jgi:hypothetical protein
MLSMSQSDYTRLFISKPIALRLLYLLTYFTLRAYCLFYNLFNALYLTPIILQFNLLPLLYLPIHPNYTRYSPIRRLPLSARLLYPRARDLVALRNPARPFSA